MVVGRGNGMGRARVILLLRRQGELRQGHAQLMYNPVWLAKRKKKGLILDDTGLAWRVDVLKREGWAHVQGPDPSDDLTSAQLPTTAQARTKLLSRLPRASLTLNLSPWTPAMPASSHNLIILPHAMSALHTLFPTAVRLFPLSPGQLYPSFISLSTATSSDNCLLTVLIPSHLSSTKFYHRGVFITAAAVPLLVRVSD